LIARDSAHARNWTELVFRANSLSLHGFVILCMFVWVLFALLPTLQPLENSVMEW